MPAHAIVMIFGFPSLSAQLTMTAGTYSHPKRGSNYDERSKEYGAEREGR